jgi:hypothetical protein
MELLLLLLLVPVLQADVVDAAPSAAAGCTSGGLLALLGAADSSSTSSAVAVACGTVWLLCDTCDVLPAAAGFAGASSAAFVAAPEGAAAGPAVEGAA